MTEYSQFTPRRLGIDQSDCILFFPLPLRFMIVCVATVQVFENFLNTHLKGGVQKFDVLLSTAVQNAVYTLCQTCLDFCLKCHLQHKTEYCRMT